MYITRIKINNRARAFVNARGSITEMHSRVCRLFPDVDGQSDLKSHAKYGVLWRRDWNRGKPGAPEYLIVTSTQAAPTPYTHYPEADVEIKTVPDFWPQLRQGELLNFRVVGNPITRVSSPEGKRSRAVPLTKAPQLESWLRRRFETVPGQQHLHPWGELVDLRFWGPAYQPDSYKHTGIKGNGQKVVISLVLFEGVMRVIDPDTTSQIVREGIVTAGKSYGAGMLSVRRFAYPNGTMDL